ncbi:uncharacterized protein LOC115628691 [Scaptodrosophila lebanonensis]|uniref:Uncharacterized protein LOC115628691 n=1 Tax=Drosophila lebanonensis TaxID=7225 RepID=A0A6J2U0T4_DROLE|nr:uncharacterized protein LOC115628691 [Scaptodrosophila lebanonensis]XP_030380727.1 uncharacterized protein LOC115628691 [Scaptodrosophila lebanonensis]
MEATRAVSCSALTNNNFNVKVLIEKFERMSTAESIEELTASFSSAQSYAKNSSSSTNSFWETQSLNGYVAQTVAKFDPTFLFNRVSRRVRTMQARNKPQSALAEQVEKGQGDADGKKVVLAVAQDQLTEEQLPLDLEVRFCVPPTEAPQDKMAAVFSRRRKQNKHKAFTVLPKFISRIIQALRNAILRLMRLLKGRQLQEQAGQEPDGVSRTLPCSIVSEPASGSVC